MKPERQWAQWLRVAAAKGVMPDAFWLLSWREWQMLNSPPQGQAMSRATLGELMRQFPDRAE